MRKMVLAAVVAMAGVVFAGGGKSVLWKGGDDGIAVYRIPALCTAPNGDLVAVCDARRDNGGDLNAFQPINIVCRRSSDGGKTWTRSEPTWKWPWTATDKWSGSDPSLIVDALAKKIFLVYNVWHWKNPDGSDRWGNVYRFHVQESSDNGKTWSKPRDITDEIAFPGWPFGRAHDKGGFIFVSSGSGIQTKDGTLLHTLVHVNDGNALFGSEDHGKTWKAFGRPVENGDECKVVELSDGSWMINSRWRGGGRQIHVTKDRGATWTSRYDKTLEDPQCNAQIMRCGGRLLFTNCKSPARRALLHLRVSEDDGETWSEGICVEPQGAAYSDMAILPGGDIGVIYEGAGYNTIVFTVVPGAGVRGEAGLPREAAERPHEVWLCAGQSNMQKGRGEFNATPAEKARAKQEMDRLARVEVWFWDFAGGGWTRLTPVNALRKSALGVSFAIRRAEATGKAVFILYAAAGGAPTESFLSRATMCAQGKDGRPLYPHLAAIAASTESIDRNPHFPCKWVAREYPRRRANMDEAYWWPVSKIYDRGIRRIKESGIKVDGILWYQGESNATTCVAPDEPTPAGYQLETLRAVVAELGALSKPGGVFLMMGLPKMGRPWEPYRAAQRKVCEETGAVYVDAFGAGLGDERDVHPRDKAAFAALAIGALGRQQAYDSKIRTARGDNKRTTARGEVR